MSHDTFISYRRSDVKISDTVYHILRSAGFSPYRDVEDLAGGYSWQDQIREALSQSNPKPYVLILCTDDAVAKSDRILEELEIAKDNDLIIVALEFDEGAAEKLLMRAGLPYAKSNHYIRNCREKLVGNGLEDALRRTLTHHILRSVHLEKDRVRSWVDAWLPPFSRASFWTDQIQSYFQTDDHADRLDSVALIARGGSGKSTLIAQFLKRQLDSPKTFPILISEADLRDLSQLAKKLGARSLTQFPEHVNWLSREPVEAASGWRPIQPLFILDGLDQMTASGDARRLKFVESIELLRQSAPIVIGCRKEVWDAHYAKQIRIRAVDVLPLDDNRIRSIASSNTPPLRLGETLNPLLRIPLYLDFALQKSSNWDSLPEQETDFLWQIIRDAKRSTARDSRPKTSMNGREWILQTIAEIQLETLQYQVPRDRITSRPGYLPEFENDLVELRNAGILRESLSKDSRERQLIRLRHDLIDTFSMASNLLSQSDRNVALARLSERIDEQCGAGLFSMLVQIAHERDDENAKREIFLEFLGILDCKRGVDDRYMARAWAVTYVLQSSFRHVYSLLLDALSGELIPSLERENVTPGARVSELLPVARLTQEAASTIGSVFDGEPAAWEDADRAVKTFSRALKLWPMKARFVEALTRHPTRDSLTSLVEFAESEMENRRDLEVLKYVAESLKHFPEPRSINVLKRLFADETLGAKIRRPASESLNAIRPGIVPKLERTPQELIDGLNPINERGGYSDWKFVQDNANFIHQRIRSGEKFGASVLDALVKAMDHDHHHARISVAGALSEFDEPAARDALINELLETTLPWDVREECLSGLKAQLNRLSDARSKQTFRLLLLEAARQAFSAGNEGLAQELRELATGRSHIESTDWITTPGALEVVRPTTTSLHTNWRIANSDIDDNVCARMRSRQTEDVGENREPKFRIVELECSEGLLRGALAETTWQCARRFHRAVQTDSASFCLMNKQWSAPIPLGNLKLPGIAVVHGMIVTNDDRLLLAQRPFGATYAPGAWSASFEEQLTDVDFLDSTDPFNHAARRGAYEEFGITVPPERVTILSVILEVDILNLGVVVLMKPDLSFAEVLEKWKGDPRPLDHSEAENVDSVALNPRQLGSIAGDGLFENQMLHPTSAARIELLRRYLDDPLGGVDTSASKEQ